MTQLELNDGKVWHISRVSAWSGGFSTAQLCEGRGKGPVMTPWQWEVLMGRLYDDGYQMCHGCVKVYNQQREDLTLKWRRLNDQST